MDFLCCLGGRNFIMAFSGFHRLIKEMFNVKTEKAVLVTIYGKWLNSTEI